MKVKELIEELSKHSPELEVVLTVSDINVESYELDHISDGWEPSGVLSLEAGEQILS